MPAKEVSFSHYCNLSPNTVIRMLKTICVRQFTLCGAFTEVLCHFHKRNAESLVGPDFVCIEFRWVLLILYFYPHNQFAFYYVFWHGKLCWYFYPCHLSNFRCVMLLTLIAFENDFYRICDDV